MAFEIKKRTPDLSPEMQAAIERSQNLSQTGTSYDQILRYKYAIMKELMYNTDLLRALHNEELEKKILDWENPNGEIYRYVNIFDFLKIPGIQSTVKNYVCFAVYETETMHYNDDIMTYEVMFRTVSHEDDYRTDWGINRQDLLAAIIKNKFDWTNDYGMHFTKTEDKERVYENGYYYREFYYQINNPNSLQNRLPNGVRYART